jgi:hypothetical protein
MDTTGSVMGGGLTATATTIPAMSPMTALSLPLASAGGSSRAAGVAPSQASAVTSASNAFEEVPDELNFNFLGPELFGMESWLALSPPPLPTTPMTVQPMQPMQGWGDMAGGFPPGGGGIS